MANGNRKRSGQPPHERKAPPVPQGHEGDDIERVLGTGGPFGPWADVTLGRELVHAAMGFAHARLERCCGIHEIEALGALFAKAAAFGTDVAKRKADAAARERQADAVASTSKPRN